tara:strand:- start:1011 stop:1208 length:198 start_codon:yes stop_codon:yes gene_type:complete
MGCRWIDRSREVVEFRREERDQSVKKEIRVSERELVIAEIHSTNFFKTGASFSFSSLTMADFSTT